MRRRAALAPRAGLRGAVAALLLASAALVAVPPAAQALPALHAEPDTRRGGVVVDALGRQVLLRGVAENSLGDYWAGNAFPPVFDLEPGDPAAMAGLGWNVVRVVVSWSRVEPAPGRYDEAYLDAIERRVALFARAGLYSIIDFHQDAWGASLAARPGEACPPGSQPALGWDGAPAWATLDGGQPRCTFSGRENNPAVKEAWSAFWRDQPAADGVGIQTRFVAMWRHLAERLARNPDVAAFELLNEPLALAPDEMAAMSAMYGRLSAAIREGERAGGGFSHIIMFEPSILWDVLAQGAPLPFAHDANAAYAPHLYTGLFTPGSPHPPKREHFQNAADEARALGGMPVITSEWGGRLAPRAEQGDPYFVQHQRLQDEFGFGAQLWLWRFSCGDPHAVDQMRQGRPVDIRGPFTVDCATNRVTGRKPTLFRQLAWVYPRAVAGREVVSSFDPAAGRFSLSYEASGGGVTEVAVPAGAYPDGYASLLDGARVLSAADAPVLELRALPGARRVRLEIAARRAGQAAASCLDRGAPSVRLARAAQRPGGHGIAVSGRAADAGCRGSAGLASRAGAVRAVALSIARRAGTRCRYVTGSGRLSRARSCRRPNYLRARGAARWSFVTRRPLPRGVYRISARAEDRAGNVAHRRLGTLRVAPRPGVRSR